MSDERRISNLLGRPHRVLDGCYRAGCIFRVEGWRKGWPEGCYKPIFHVFTPEEAEPFERLASETFDLVRIVEVSTYGRLSTLLEMHTVGGRQ